ncbi:hypothetical protein DFJ77DRAFT_440710 [Powellomyces hirtus]|nr:hypothetical protein DFJ77DRAFT_440710 [Powellomyces hirtus]
MRLETTSLLAFASPIALVNVTAQGTLELKKQCVDASNLIFAEDLEKCFSLPSKDMIKCSCENWLKYETQFDWMMASCGSVNLPGYKNFLSHHAMIPKCRIGDYDGAEADAQAVQEAQKLEKLAKQQSDDDQSASNSNALPVPTTQSAASAGFACQPHAMWYTMLFTGALSMLSFSAS